MKASVKLPRYRKAHEFDITDPCQTELFPKKKKDDDWTLEDLFDKAETVHSERGL